MRTLVAGPFRFVDLIAPQVAARLGLGRTAASAAGAVLTKATVMLVADAVGSIADFLARSGGGSNAFSPLPARLGRSVSDPELTERKTDG